MKQVTFSVSDNFSQTLRLDGAGVGQGLHSLTISGQWAGAKNPEASVQRYAGILSTEDLRALHGALGDYLQEAANA